MAVKERKERASDKRAREKGDVFTAKVQVLVSPEQRKKVKTISEVCQRAMNVMWQDWLIKHVSIGNRHAIRSHIANVQKWHDDLEASLPKLTGKEPVAVQSEIKDKRKQLTAAYKKKNPKPVQFFQCFPDDLNIYKNVVAECPELNTKNATLMVKIFSDKLSQRKSAHGQWPGWMNIVATNDNMDAARAPIAIPINGNSCSLTKNNEGRFMVNVKFNRVLAEDPNRRGSVDLESYKVYFKDKRHFASMAHILEGIVDGITPLASMNVSVNKNGKVFVSIAFRKKPSPKICGGSGVAILRAAKHCPWRIRFLDTENERSRDWDSAIKAAFSGSSPFARRPAIGRRGGTGHYVASQRERICMQQWSRKTGKRYRGQGARGRGYKRYNLAIENLSRNWNDFTETCNQRWAKELIRDCENRGVSTIVYLQPNGGDDRFLATAGKTGDFKTSSTWPWHNFKVALEAAAKKSKYGIRIYVPGDASGREMADIPQSLAGYIGKYFTEKKKGIKRNSPR